MSKKSSRGLPFWHNLLITFLIILFFLGIILAYYFALFSETRDNIIFNGEINAIRAANQIDRQLYTGVDAIELTAYTLDNMLREGRTQEDIRDFVTDQSTATAIVVSEQSNGIYGYINGQYEDGVGWIPDEDYVPTERPWYLEAMANPGEVVVIDPYLDAQTGVMIITFAKSLSDGESVVAIDISMAQLQELTENIASHGSSDLEIVLDQNDQVISHSDSSQVGRNYAAETDSFGGALVQKLQQQEAGERFFSLKYDGVEYIAYAMEVENHWTCISITDTTGAFRRLVTPLVLTVVASVLIILLLLFLMVRVNRKDAFAEHMKELAARQTEYAYKDQMTGVGSRRAYAEALTHLKKDGSGDFCIVIFDVNGLKRLNDMCGHEAGDELIKATAACIRNAFPGVESLYRTGGDEFCAILSWPEEKVIESLHSLETLTAAWQGAFVDGFSLSYGYAMSRDCDGVDATVSEADHSMYEYKTKYYATAEHDRRRER